MAHGGIKYLETGDLKLVRQSVSARNKLIQMFPQYVKPLKLCVPVSSFFGGTMSAAIRLFKTSVISRNRGKFLLEIGLRIYDILSVNNRVLPKHRHLNTRYMRTAFPGLSRCYSSAFLYFEGAISHPERIALELVDNACEKNEDVCALNYFEFIERTPNGLKVRDIIADDLLYIKPRLVVNAGGAWIDRVNARIHPFTKSSFIDGVKGSHLILHSDALNAEVGDSGFVWENTDGRLCILYPIDDKVILGSTELRITNPDEVRCTDEEVKYLLTALSRLFPKVVIQKREIIFRYSGTRALNATNEKNPGAVGRDHKIVVLREEWDTPKTVVNMIGGKWTTHSFLGKEVATLILKELEKKEELLNIDDRGRNNPSIIPINNSTTQISKFPMFISRYGSERAKRIAHFCTQSNDVYLQHLPGYSKNEISWFILKEAAVKLEDILFRRTNVAFTRRITTAMIEEIANILMECLNKSESEIKKEVLEFTKLLIERNGVSFPDKYTNFED